MENLKLKINEMIRYDMDYIPEIIADQIVYQVNSDKSGTKEEFLKKFMTENKDLLELYTLSEQTKIQKKTFKILQLTSIIIAISVFCSFVISLILMF